jgi:hypothetical protein
MIAERFEERLREEFNARFLQSGGGYDEGDFAGGISRWLQDSQD